jgi:transcription elongation factor Elf1
MTQKQYYAKVKREINRAGLKPIKAQWDEAGNCVYCGEAGRCPGWHAQNELNQFQCAHCGKVFEFTHSPYLWCPACYGFVDPCKVDISLIAMKGDQHHDQRTN